MVASTTRTTSSSTAIPASAAPLHRQQRRRGKYALLAVKGNDAIPFPHDGPIYRRLVHQQQLRPDPAVLNGDEPTVLQQQNENASSAATDSIQRCLALLMRQDWNLTRVIPQVEKAAPESPFERLVHCMLSKLLYWQAGDVSDATTKGTAPPPPPRVQDQLQALQAFKSSLLQLQQQQATQRKEQQQATETKLSNDEQRNLDDDDAALVALVYDILLEFSCASQTTLPLRRAMHSNCLALREYYYEYCCIGCSGRNNDDDGDAARALVLTNVEQDLLESITSPPVVGSNDMGHGQHGTVVCWDKPLHSLEGYVSYLSLWTDKNQKSRQQKQQLSPSSSSSPPPPSPPLDSARAVKLSLRFMHVAAASLLPTLQAHDFSSSTGSSRLSLQQDAAVSSSATAIMMAETGTVNDAAVQDAVQIAILYSTLADLCPTRNGDHDEKAITGNWLDICGGSQEEEAATSATTFSWSHFLASLLACCLVSTDALPSVGVAYGRAVVTESSLNKNNEWIELLVQQDNGDEVTTGWSLHMFPDLPRAFAVQGVAACISNQDLLFSQGSNNRNPAPLPLLVFLKVFASMAQSAIDPEVRLIALKGLRTLTSRCRAMLTKSQMQANDSVSSAASIVQYDAMQTVAQHVLEIVLEAWDCPPTRKLASQIPALFESVVELQDQLFSFAGNTSTNSGGDQNRPSCWSRREDFLHEMVKRLLQQPPHRKGRYNALETLLPRPGAASLMIGQHNNDNSSGSHNSSTSTLLQDLLVGVADQGHNTGAMAELWAKLLQHLLKELGEKSWPAPSTAENDEMNDDVVVVTVQAKQMLTRKERLRKQRHLSEDQDSKNQDDPRHGQPVTTRVVRRLPVDWIHTWVPSLANALVIDTELKRRKQVAAFCLPRIITMVNSQPAKGSAGGPGDGRGGPGDSSDAAAQAFTALLEHVQSLSVDVITLEIPSVERETLSDRKLWAICEIIRYAQVERLLDPSVMGLRQAAAKALPLPQLRQALVHSSPAVRLSAYQCMEAIIETYDMATHGGALSGGVMLQLDLWKNSLLYDVKTDIREHLSTRFCCLLSFLDRLSVIGSRTNGHDATSGAPIVYHFVVGFLLYDVFVRKTAYPGTVNAKETFALTMLECLVVFFCRDLNLAMDSKLLPKTGSVFQRKRSPIEEDFMSDIRKQIVGREVLASLFSLLRSCWDGTRVAAFGMLSTLTLLARSYNIALPDDFVAENDSLSIDRHAVFLASSPRQRESDTGARILAFNCLCKRSFPVRLACMQGLLALLEQRIDQMRDKLAAILSDDEDLRKGTDLPLAHGIIQALRLILESCVLSDRGDVVPSDVTQTLAQLTCRAMQVSLSVVADVREGEFVDGMDEDLAFSTVGRVSRVRSTTGKVNPGAIGANGIFSSINRLDSDEQERRMASQRIVMGSWYLIRESTGAISSVLTAQRTGPELEQLVKEAGALLISTLTSLKHIGAAYASHAAFQHIAKVCLGSPTLHALPMEWTLRLFEEITSAERVRDSTLRRSTGYVLGFLAVMHAEVTLKSQPRAICQLVMKNILRYSLPAQGWLKNFLGTIKAENDERGLFSFFSDSQDMDLIDTDAYEERTRVHALNILRLIILDAPLSSEVLPLVGDAIIISIMGYLDSAWTIRNSSTMVFAAAMLRVVDADKNAANVGKTGKNAISVTELFRSYPSLSSFLRSVLQCSVTGSLLVGRGEFILPPILPILVLLYRVQPVAESGQDAVTHINPFIPVVILCLDHSHMAVRHGAALALANMVSKEANSQASVHNLLDLCERAIDQRPQKDWNQLHGTLLVMKELLNSSVGATSLMIERGFASELLKLVDVTSGLARIPPSCMAVVLQILEGLINASLSEDMILDACLEAIRWLAFGHIRLVDSIGLSDLSAAASSIACRLALKASLIPEKTSSRLRQLFSLLTCNEADVRVTATKTLKKLINGHLEKEGLDSLAETLVDALESEVHRDERLDDPVGAHPPTLRRLSRCILRVLHAQEGIMEPPKKGIVDGRLWALGLALLDAEVIFAEEPDLGATPLLGNAAELMAFAIKAERSADSRQEMTKTLLKVLVRLSNPALSWTLRHSAAVALGSIESVDTSEHGVVARRVSLNLLQDADVDVQFSASRACMSWLPSLSKCCVPELVLEHAYLKGDETISSVRDLIDPLIETSRLLEQKIKLFSAEIKATAESDHGSDVLLNVSTERKIFEEEDPNPFLERALAVQLAVAAMMARTSRIEKHDHATNTHTDQLMEMGQRILALLSQQYVDASTGHSSWTDHSIIHELTRSSSIFPDLHSLLLAVACMLCLGAADIVETDTQRSLRDMALDMVMNNSRTGNLMNPCIRQVFSTLSRKENDSPISRKEVLSCCFLLP
jgi:Putative death-receptor fusion protein (DUF2428)